MPENELNIHSQTLKMMGNRFSITVVHANREFAENQIANAIRLIQHIENQLSTFQKNSQTNQINDKAGIEPVKVSSEVFGLIQRCTRISELTQGAFDISYGSIDKSLWNFDKTMIELPSLKVARQMVRLINYKNIVLHADENSVFLQKKGMRIGFGGIGKGYAAERAKQLLQQNGITSGVVNAAGDLCTWGKQPDGKDWTIGIADPEHKESVFSYLTISDMAVATSGNYEKFITIGGKKYSHTIDPKTGLPVSGIKSVTIIAPNAEIADALATPITVMGVKVGLNLINQMKHIACIIIDEQNQLYTSKNIYIS